MSTNSQVLPGEKHTLFKYAPVKLRRARAFIPFFPCFAWEAISFKNIVFNFLSVCVAALDGIGVGVKARAIGFFAVSFVDVDIVLTNNQLIHKMFINFPFGKVIWYISLSHYTQFLVRNVLFTEGKETQSVRQNERSCLDSNCELTGGFVLDRLQRREAAVSGLPCISHTKNID